MRGPGEEAAPNRGEVLEMGPGANLGEVLRMGPGDEAVANIRGVVRMGPGDDAAANRGALVNPDAADPSTSALKEKRLKLIGEFNVLEGKGVSAANWTLG